MRKRLVFLCFAIAAMMMVSCSDSSESEEEIIGKMLSSQQIEILENLDLPLYSGSNPPDITGYYVANDFDCIRSTDGHRPQNLHYYYNFYGKKGTKIKLDYYNLGTDRAVGNGAYIFC